MNDFDLSGNRALVTGGGTGLGRQIAGALADAGADVVICGRRLDVLQQTAEDLAASRGTVVPFPCDLTEASTLGVLADAADRIDILVNNAGRADRTPWQELSVNAWRNIMMLNVEVPFRLCQLFIPPMIDRNWGRVINVASMYGLVAGDRQRNRGPGVDMASYIASKHGLIGLTKFLATQVGGTGVTVNALCPGLFPSPANQELLSTELVARLEEGTPVGRLGNDTDLRTAALFLASAGSSFVTGHSLVVDGGWTCW